MEHYKSPYILFTALIFSLFIGFMLRNGLYKQHLQSNPTLLGDAADYANAAESIHVLKFLKTREKTDLYNNDRFPGFPLTLRVFQLLWKDKADASYRTSMFFGLIIIICTFFLTMRVGNPAASMLSSFLVAINPTLCLNAVEGCTEELYSVQILLFFFAFFWKTPKKHLQIAILTSIGSYMALTRGEGFLIPVITVGYLLYKKRRNISSARGYLIAPVMAILVNLFFQWQTGNIYSQRLGHFYYWHEFLSKKGIPFIETPYRYIPLFDYLFKYHTIPTLITHGIKGFFVLIGNLDGMIGLYFSVLWVVASIYLAIKTEYGIVPLTLGITCILPVFFMHSTAHVRLFYGYLSTIFILLTVCWIRGYLCIHAINYNNTLRIVGKCLLICILLHYVKQSISKLYF